MSAPDPVAPDPLTRALGRVPTADERAIHADQAHRLAAIWDHPLLRHGSDLACLPPMRDEDCP
ncbi:MAG: hypothetical protein ACK4YU_01085 [Paracoccus sp. (in: a-proteobacteria)]